LDDDSIQTTAQTVESLVTQNGGTVVRSEIWGKRKLAYEVKKHSEGTYILFRFSAGQEVLPRLENHFKLTETIIRYLLLHLDEHTLRLEEEQERRKEAELARGAEREARDDGEDDDDDDRPRRRSDRDDRGHGRGSRRRDEDDDDDD
jgi:small subunit ribosomal protein S6